MLRILWVVRNRIVKNVKKSQNMPNGKSGISSQINLDGGRFPCGSVIKNPRANAGDIREAGLIPRKIPWRRAWKSTPVFLPGESHGAWWATVHRVTKSGT